MIWTVSVEMLALDCLPQNKAIAYRNIFQVCRCFFKLLELLVRKAWKAIYTSARCEKKTTSLEGREKYQASLSVLITRRILRLKFELPEWSMKRWSKLKLKAGSLNTLKTDVHSLSKKSSTNRLEGCKSDHADVLQKQRGLYATFYSARTLERRQSNLD